MAFLAGLVYYLTVFVVYGAAVFGAVMLGSYLRKKKNAKAVSE